KEHLHGEEFDAEKAGSAVRSAVAEYGALYDGDLKALEEAGCPERHLARVKKAVDGGMAAADKKVTKWTKAGEKAQKARATLAAHEAKEPPSGNEAAHDKWDDKRLDLEVARDEAEGAWEEAGD